MNLGSGFRVLEVPEAGLLQALGEQLLQTQDTYRHRIVDAPVEHQAIDAQPVHLGAELHPARRIGRLLAEIHHHEALRPRPARQRLSRQPAPPVHGMGQDLFGRQQIDHVGYGAEPSLAELPASAGVTAPEEDLHDLHRRLVALLGVARDLRLEREIVIEQALTPLRLFRQAKADLHLAVGQREAAQQGQPAARRRRTLPNTARG